MEVMYTPEQYSALMKLVYLGNWMANGIKITDERNKKFDAIQQRIFQDAEDASCGRFAEYDEHLKKYFPTQEFEEDAEVVGAQKEYTAEIFWAELVERLAQRDFMAHYGMEKIKAMSEREQKKAYSEHVKRYVDEFEKNELAHLMLSL